MNEKTSLPRFWRCVLWGFVLIVLPFAIWHLGVAVVFHFWVATVAEMAGEHERAQRNAIAGSVWLGVLAVLVTGPLVAWGVLSRRRRRV